MVALNRIDWEDRMWLLTHDLVLAKAVLGAVEVLEVKELFADAIVVASTTVAAYRVVVERATGDGVEDSR